MRALIFVVLAACSASAPPPPKSEPAPSPAAPPAAAVMTKEECEAKGARVNPSIGGGSQIHCTDDETDLGPVRLGLEGGWCCQLKK